MKQRIDKQAGRQWRKRTPIKSKKGKKDPPQKEEGQGNCRTTRNIIISVQQGYKKEKMRSQDGKPA